MSLALIECPTIDTLCQTKLRDVSGRAMVSRFISRDIISEFDPERSTIEVLCQTKCSNIYLVWGSLMVSMFVLQCTVTEFGF